VVISEYAIPAMDLRRRAYAEQQQHHHAHWKSDTCTGRDDSPALFPKRGEENRYLSPEQIAMI